MLGASGAEAGPSPPTERPPAAAPASAAAGSAAAANRPATGATASPAAAPTAHARAAAGAVVERPPSARPLRVTKPIAEHRDPLECPTNLGSSVLSFLGGAFSFMCVIRMDGFDHWSRVFDFSLEADDDSITAGAIGLTQDLHFTVFRGKRPFSVRANDFLEPGRVFTMMCTVSASGHMRVFKNGVVVAENPDGMAPLSKPRPRMIVGGHYRFRDQAFRGSLRDVKVWDQEISWTDAMRG